MKVPGILYVQGRNAYSDVDSRKYGIAIHNTSNDASDTEELSYATRRTDGVSAHFYVDGDSVSQSLDTESRAGHAGSKIGNENSIAVEIRGGNGMTRAWWLQNVAWTELGRVLAYVITHDTDYDGFQIRRASVAEMRANPKVKAFYGHDDMRQAWGGTTHTDPGPNFPWDRLFDAVNTSLTEDDMSGELADKALSKLGSIMGTQEQIFLRLSRGEDPVYGTARLRAEEPWWQDANLKAIAETLKEILSTLDRIAGAESNVDVAAVKAHIDTRIAELVASLPELVSRVGLTMRQ